MKRPFKISVVDTREGQYDRWFEQRVAELRKEGWSRDEAEKRAQIDLERYIMEAPHP